MCPEHRELVKQQTNGKPRNSGRRESTAAEVWAKVTAGAGFNQCHCGLTEDMSRDELRHTESCKKNYICSTLDHYRRLVGI